MNKNGELLVGRDCIVCGCFIPRTGKGYCLYCPVCLKEKQLEYKKKSIQNFCKRFPHYSRDWYRSKRRGFDGEVVAVTCVLCNDLVLTNKMKVLYCKSCSIRANFKVPRDFHVREDNKILFRLKNFRDHLLKERYGEYREWVKPI